MSTDVHDKTKPNCMFCIFAELEYYDSSNMSDWGLYCQMFGEHVQPDSGCTNYVDCDADYHAEEA